MSDLDPGRLLSRRLGLLLAAFGFLSPQLESLAATYEPSRITPPKPVREFRAAWVATVGNIDWPSRKGLTTAEQKAEMIAILDRAAELRLNAIVFQVRPACDALYASTLEPWSEYLTGHMGQAPEPYYDPLAFAIEEAHRRGLELHAWFNPYRAGHPSAKGTPAPTHITKTRPQLVRHYGSQLWLDPGEKEVQDYSLKVVLDVVRRYDVDGIHFDDYFYPYKEKDDAGREMDFPDEPSWQRFGAGGKLDRDDWRRENVNLFVHRVYEAIKSAKPWVKFGISPFGIWRPGNPQQIKGFDAYASLYADSRKWLASGWVDYFAPQLYWAIEPPDQSFAVLLKWWAGQNRKSRHLWPGLDSTKTGTRSGPEGTAGPARGARWKPDEILAQIQLARNQDGADGHIHWNMKSLMRSGGLGDRLQHESYAQPALIPASPWLGSGRPERPTVRSSAGEGGSRLSLEWTPGGPHKPWLWLVQTRISGQWQTEVLSGNKTAEAWHGALPEVVAVSAVDRVGNASPAAVVELKR